MSDLTAISWWMGALTVLVAVQTVAVAFIAVKGIALFRRTESTLDSVDRALEPITEGTRELLQDLHALRETAQRAERGVNAAIDRVSATTGHVKHAVVARFWPLYGALTAGRAIVKSLSARKRQSASRPASKLSREDEDARARFVAEGGPIHDAR